MMEIYIYRIYSYECLRNVICLSEDILYQERMYNMKICITDFDGDLRILELVTEKMGNVCE